MWLSRLLVVLLAFALCVPTEAQQPKKVARIGFLSPGYEPSPISEAFVAGMRELGYIEGRNITIGLNTIMERGGWNGSQILPPRWSA